MPRRIRKPFRDKPNNIQQVFTAITKDPNERSPSTDILDDLEHPATSRVHTGRYVPPRDSSLPPSSPPSTSSVLLDAPKDDENFGIARNNDDPFGFFAAEEKLKQRRGQERPVSVRPRESLTLASSGEDNTPDRHAFATPPAHRRASTTEDDNSSSARETPKKQVLEKRKPLASPSSNGTASPISSSPPSTPSPSKDRRQGISRSPSAPRAHGNRRSRKKKVKETVIEDGDADVDEDEDPHAFSEKLLACLPKRPARRLRPRTRGVATVKENGKDDESDGEVARKPKTRAGNTKGVRIKRVRKTVKKGSKAEDPECSEEEDEVRLNLSHFTLQLI